MKISIAEIEIEEPILVVEIAGHEVARFFVRDFTKEKAMAAVYEYLLGEILPHFDEQNHRKVQYQCLLMVSDMFDVHQTHVRRAIKKHSVQSGTLATMPLTHTVRGIVASSRKDNDHAKKTH
ncbi:MAG: hypothetical protein ACOVSW_17980 [Candidatus Kapaibacteriota bacterium]